MDIFVLTSLLEGLPNVLIEAQAVGLPVVCSGAGGMREAFVEGKTGYSVPSASSDAFAGAVGRLVEDDILRATMGAAGQQHARRMFSIERMIESTIKAYVKAPKLENRVDGPDWQSLDLSSEIWLGGAVKDQGHGFTADLPPGTNVSSLCLWEDDHRLGPAHAKKSEVRSLGRGRYASTGRQILFSSSDNSDIRFNGRAYRLRSEDAAQRFDEIILKPELVNREIGYCYIAHLELGAGSQRFAVWENKSRLGPGYCLHDEIRTRGMGRYSIWGPALYFSNVGQ